MPLFLYQISRKGVPRHQDYYDSAVVAASTIQEAVLIHPGEIDPEAVGMSWDESTWVHPKDVSVECIGVAFTNVEKGVICASYNAG